MNIECSFICPVSKKTIHVDWDFITEYNPDYFHANEIAWEDDLDCALSDECDDEKLDRIKEEWGETREEWEKAHDQLYMEICQEAMSCYKRRLTKISNMTQKEQKDTQDFKSKWVLLHKEIADDINSKEIYIHRKQPYTFCSAESGDWKFWRINPTLGCMPIKDLCQCTIAHLLNFQYQYNKG